VFAAGQQEIAMSSIRSRLFALSLALFAGAGAQAADIDLFANSQSTADAAPQVLFLMDTGASFSASNNVFRCNISSTGVIKTDGTGLAADFTGLDQTNGGVEQCAMYALVQALISTGTKVKVGVMFLNNNQADFNPVTNTYGSNCVNGYGGCLALPITLIDGDTTTARNILTWIRGWTTSGNGVGNIKSPANRGDGAMMQEAWAYYFGKVGVSQRDYSSIAPGGSCATKNVVYLANNYNQQASPKDSTNTAQSPLLRLNGSSLVSSGQRASPAATTIELGALGGMTQATGCGTNLGTVPTDEGSGAAAVNWALYMRDHGITTFTVGVEAASGNSCDATYGAWLNRIGSPDIGGGDFYHTPDFQSLVDALKSITAKIASVNSVFAAVSLPVSVNTQGTYLNEIYIGMFRPAVNFLARWTGNLKQYKLGMTSAGVLRMQDADSNLAINTNTGFITECARSYWTPNVTDNYWAATPSGGCLTITGANNSNYPDGNIVEKGAEAYKLRNKVPANRTVKTCSTVFASCTSLTDFTTTTLTVSAAFATDLSLVNWARGQNLDSELGMSTSVMRSTAHGDIVHSRPIPINYGTDAAPQIVVYYGGNDGMFRAVNGNRGSSTYTVTGVITAGTTQYEAGDEIWSFVPPEFYSSFQRQRDDIPAISTPATSSNVSTQKNYGMDGPTTAFQGTIGGVGKVYVYSTMRRGGRAMYAFDTTSPTSPALLWKRGCPNAGDDTGCSTGYSGIGQTWSALKTMFAAAYGSGASPMLIAGGGYDNCEDYDALSAGGANHACTSSTKGNKVYVIDAATGAIVKAFNTDRAVIADSTLVKDNSTGFVKYAYAADLGGNVYRMDFTNANAANWTITKIASLGCDTLSGCTANRKFMFAPSVVTTDNDTFYVMLGSGDREKPIRFFAASAAVTNYFFSIKDVISNGAAGYTDTANCGSGTNTLCLRSLLQIGAGTPTASQLAATRGWYLGLVPTEQVVTSAITVFGVVTFSTHQPAGAPDPNMCKPNLGTTNVYNISYLNAATANGTTNRFEHVSGDGLPPSPVAGQVTLDNGQTVPFCIGCSKDSPLEGAPPRSLSTVSQPTNRLFWYIQK
jgi:type IV pilus assembly protein PilY1